MKNSKLRILVLQGPNLNLLGERELEIYGQLTLAGLARHLRKWVRIHYSGSLKISLNFYQSNHEGRLIDRLHRDRHRVEGIVFNPGAFTHYSYALRDAVAAIAPPVVEVHLSDIRKREAFRRVSVIKPACRGQFSGGGVLAYERGLELLVAELDKNALNRRRGN